MRKGAPAYRRGPRTGVPGKRHIYRLLVDLDDPARAVMPATSMNIVRGVDGLRLTASRVTLSEVSSGGCCICDFEHLSNAIHQATSKDQGTVGELAFGIFSAEETVQA